jgi:TetR/AcrR family fatty acid metabolism transcriptional regulator
MTDQSVIDRKRNAILDAARTVFSRCGYDGAAVGDVASEAGVAKGTLYLYFKSKEELYLEALARDLGNVAHRARAEMDRAPTLRDQVLAFLRVRLAYAAANKDFLRIYLAEYGSLFVKSSRHRELCRLARENSLYMKRLVEQAARRREIRSVEAGAVATALFSIVRGLLETRILGWKDFQAADEAEFAVDLLWRGIGREVKARGTERKRAEARRE